MDHRHTSSERLTGEDLNFQEAYLSLAILEWDSLRSFVGQVTIAEVGDIGRFTDPKQIQKLAGLKIVKKSSGKKKGQPRISKRGRRKL